MSAVPKKFWSLGRKSKKKLLRLNQECHLLVEDEDGPYKSPSLSPRHSVSSTGSTSSQGKDSSSRQKQDHGGSQSSKAGLAKLARFLIQKDKSSEKMAPGTTVGSPPSSQDVGVVIRKATSIDSLLDASSSSQTMEVSDDTSGVYSATSGGLGLGLVVPSGFGHGNNNKIPSSPSVPAKLEAHKKGIPNSPSMPSKLAKGVPAIRQGSMELLLEGLALTKAERKKLEKLNKFNIDLQALFAAVEHQHIDRARSILDTTDVDVNSVNSDGFTPLDIAVMTRNAPIVKLLQSYGAKESTRFPNKESRISQLGSLVKEAERCVDDLSTCVMSASANTSSLSTALLKEKERQLTLWERRLHLLKDMKSGFEELSPPDPPTSVTLEVVGTRALRVKFTEPETANDPNILVTKYRVEWCRYEDFSLVAGFQEVMDVQRLEVTIPDLTQGTAYYVRVAAGNGKGYSSFKVSSPLCATPSSWRDVDSRKPRSAGRLGRLDDLFNQVSNSRPAYAAEIKILAETNDSTPQQQRRQVRKSIKNLFTPAPKFQKTMKRGIYLACLLYNEDRVLVTTEETLPILEIDETYPSSLHTDFHWMMKVACTWEDVKTLRQDMEKSHSSSTVHFRSKLLQTVEQMQSALGIQDLGQLYYKPLKDAEGTIVLCTVKYISEPKCVNTLSVRWIPLAKIQRKMPSSSDGGEMPTAGELLLSSLQEMMTYNQVSNIPLSRGLYLGYVKLKSSVDLIRVLVSHKTPNVLPHHKIRENPHVSCEEWAWLKALRNPEESTTPTDVQLKFQKVISSAARNLFTHFDIPMDQYDGHRLYDVEVIELSHEVSFILILPPVESVCSVPGQMDELTSRADCIPLPVQIFEMIHMGTYQHNFIAKYSRISSILEMDNVVAQHANREAFSSSEVASARQRLNQLQDFQTKVDHTWRGMRWIMDVLTYARDKVINGGISMNFIWCQADTPSPQPSPVQSPVQPPPTRRMSRVDDLIDSKMFLGISNSSSNYSLTVGGKNGLEIRRCASASRLASQPLGGCEEAEDCEYQEGIKSFSSERLTGNYEFDSDDTEGISVMCPPLECPEALEERLKQMSSEKTDGLLSSSRQNLQLNLGRSNKPLSPPSEPETNTEDDSAENVSTHSRDSSSSAGDSHNLPKESSRAVDSFNKPTLCSPTSSGSQSPIESQPDVLRVYAAYESGLPAGTSIKIHVTPMTTAREVVDLVVKQLNTAVILKGKDGPIYSSEHLSDFCLVAVVGSRERCLSDDFQPLKLQNPWTKGKLFVRLRDTPSSPQRDCVYNTKSEL